MRKEDLFIYGYDCEVVRERVKRGDIVPEAVGFTYSDYAGVNAYMDGDTVVAPLGRSGVPDCQTGDHDSRTA